MARALKQLPTSYREDGVIDLSQNKAALLALMIASVVLLVVFSLLLIRLMAVIRPDFSLTVGMIELLMVVVVSVVITVVHEAIHGVFFWLFTKEKPVFGASLLYAYAGAPDWYIRRDAYAVVGMAPLVVITVVGMALLWVVPTWAILPVILAVVLNASGAAGDMGVIGYLFTKPPSTYVCDTGDRMTFYRNAAE